ncbi:hypothetical protein KCF3NO3_34510 [Chryseobacterium sp. KCF3-3]
MRRKNTIDGSVRFYIGTWSLISAAGLGHNNTFGLFTITRLNNKVTRECGKGF